MSAIGASVLVFSSLVVGAFIAFALRKLLPQHHLTADSKEVIRLGTGMIGTMAALLLGLLVASAKSSYDTKNSELIQVAAKVSFLDRLLAHYGPEANEARKLLHAATERIIGQMWPTEVSEPVQLDPTAARAEVLYEALHKLSPQNETQKDLKAQAVGVATDIAQIRWLLLAQTGSSISTPMLVIMVFWLSIVFLSFGLFTSPNATVIITLLLCAMAVSGAIYLILELDQPFGGQIQISSAAMRDALDHLGK